MAALGIASLALVSEAVAQSRPTTIALSPYLGVLWSFEAELGGKPRTFLFDTGGGITVITPATATEIGCTPWGQLSGFRMRGERVDMTRCDGLGLRTDGVDLTARTVGVIDFDRLLPKGAPPLAGSVALDAFAAKIVTIDLAHRQIVLETAESLGRRIENAREIEFHIAREVSGRSVTPFVAVRTPKGNLWMELDTAAIRRSSSGVTMRRSSECAPIARVRNGSRGRWSATCRWRRTMRNPCR